MTQKQKYSKFIIACILSYFLPMKTKEDKEKRKVLQKGNICQTGQLESLLIKLSLI